MLIFAAKIESPTLPNPNAVDPAAEQMRYQAELEVSDLCNTTRSEGFYGEQVAGSPWLFLGNDRGF